MNVDQIVKRAQTLKTRRGTWENHWQEIADLMAPNHPRFVGEEEPGTKKGLKMYDSVGAHASELLSAGLNGLLTNPASRWFEHEYTDEGLKENKEANEWLFKATTEMYDQLNNNTSAFSTHIHEMYLEYCVFGTGILFVCENKNRDGLFFKSVPLSEACIAENSEGRVDTVHRHICNMTAKQVYDKWGDGVSSRVKKKIEDGKYDEFVKIIHVVEPSWMHKMDNFEYTDFYIEEESKHLLSKSGFMEFPYAVPRFYKAGGEVYGRGPGITSLPDVKMVNEMMKTTIKAAQKIVDPPLQAPSQGFLNPIRTIPGGINYYNAGSKDKIEPLLTGGNVPLAAEMMEEVRNRIRSVFFIDQLMLIRGPEMTATEVMQRTEETMRLMGPILGRLQSEALGPIIDRVFAILERQNKFGEFPIETDDDIKLEVKYTSPIARAQRQMEANSLQRVLEILTPFASIDPTIFEKFNSDEIMEGVSEMFGLRPTFLRSEDELKQIRDERAEATEAQQQVDVLKTATEAGANIATINQMEQR